MKYSSAEKKQQHIHNKFIALYCNFMILATMLLKFLQVFKAFIITKSMLGRQTAFSYVCEVKMVKTCLQADQIQEMHTEAKYSQLHISILFYNNCVIIMTHK